MKHTADVERVLRYIGDENFNYVEFRYGAMRPSAPPAAADEPAPPGNRAAEPSARESGQAAPDAPDDDLRRQTFAADGSLRNSWSAAFASGDSAPASNGEPGETPLAEEAPPVETESDDRTIRRTAAREALGARARAEVARIDGWARAGARTRAAAANRDHGTEVPTAGEPSSGAPSIPIREETLQGAITTGVAETADPEETVTAPPVQTGHDTRDERERGETPLSHVFRRLG